MSVQRQKVALVVVVCFILTGLFVLGSPAHACMTPVECYELADGTIVCFGGGSSGLAYPGDVTVTMLPHHRALIRIGNYVTPKMGVTYDCSVAFAPIPGIERVNRVTLVNSKTGRPLPNYSFVPNSAANSEYVQLLNELGITTPTEGWQGFSTEVLNGSRGGIVHYFLLEATLKEGVTPEQLYRAIREHGMLANGSANPDGTLNFGHYHLRSLGIGGLTLIAPRAEVGSRQ